MKRFLLFFTMISMVLLTACGGQGSGDKPTLVFADAGWDSIRFHNHVARFILEEGYGYKTDVTPGNTAATFTGLKTGDIDIYMEIWTSNIKKMYNKALDAGKVKEVGVNFNDNAQGFWVPTYVIEGDPERGIEPMAPDLKTVKDLAKYPELFKGPTGKPRIIGAPPGWAVDKILAQKVKTYGLDKYEYFRPGSPTALASSITKAVEQGDPWVGYYWTPTWLMGKYDMTLLKEPKYSEEKWENGYACEFPPNKVAIAVTSELPEKAPEVEKFLSKYHTSADLTNKALLYMQKNDAKPKAAAKWWMKKHTDLWTKWVPDDVAKKVKEALKG